MRWPQLPICLAILGVSGCSWSNSLYLARQYTAQAQANERKGRPFEAQILWGQVLVKADSAWARSGDKKFEARGYRGIAHARLGDCPAGIPDLESALYHQAGGRWEELAHFELGRCYEQLHLAGAEAQLRGLLNSRDPAMRLQAGVVLSQVYLDRQAWPQMLALLPDLDHPALRFGRAVADFATGKVSEGRLQVQPLLTSRDTLVAWSNLIEVLAESRNSWADSLIGIISAFPHVSLESRSEWLLAGVRAAVSVHDTAAANVWLVRLGRLDATASLFEARRVVGEDQIAQVASLDDLARVVVSLPATGPEDGGPNSRMLEIRRTAGQMLSEKDSLSGVPLGDLRLFGQAEDAAQILHAPALARASLERIEHDWPDSPYLVKALMARMIVEPDSEEAIRARLELHNGSAYLAALHLEDDGRYSRLEDSLGTFLKLRAAAAFNRASVVNESFRQ